jgi:SAM-dependent methyltransferase
MPMEIRRIATTTVRRAARRAAPAVNRFGGLTTTMLRRYCTGQGIEVGPGPRPYVSDALLVDRFYSHHGRQIALDAQADAAQLPFRDACFDFVVSAHCLEHHPATLRTLRDWVRVLRDGGYLVLLLPHVDRTFDRGRPVAPFEHLDVEDEEFSLDDPPHWDEYERVILSEPPDPECRNPDGSWRRRWFVENGSIHYHCWTQHEMAVVFIELGLQLCAVIEELPDRRDTFMVVGRLHVGGYAPESV